MMRINESGHSARHSAPVCLYSAVCATPSSMIRSKHIFPESRTGVRTRASETDEGNSRRPTWPSGLLLTPERTNCHPHCESTDQVGHQGDHFSLRTRETARAEKNSRASFHAVDVVKQTNRSGSRLTGSLAWVMVTND